MLILFRFMISIRCIVKTLFHLINVIYPNFRYPSNQNDFYASRLPGTFEEDKAGIRLKLATPMTWETQIAM